MSTAHAFFIILLLAAGLTLVVWVIFHGWSPEQLPLWAGLIWGLIALVSVAPALLPAAIRWSYSVRIIQVILGVVVAVLSVKSLIVLLRHGASLSSTQRWSAYLGLVPFVLGLLAVLVFFWIAGAFNSKK